VTRAAPQPTGGFVGHDLGASVGVVGWDPLLAEGVRFYAEATAGCAPIGGGATRVIENSGSGSDSDRVRVGDSVSDSAASVPVSATGQCQ